MANGFYKLCSTEHVLWSAVEVFLCVQTQTSVRQSRCSMKDGGLIELVLAIDGVASGKQETIRTWQDAGEDSPEG